MYDIEILPSAWKGHREFADWLVRRTLPTMMVDLGVDYGYSTFCLAAPNIGTVCGIDTFAGDVHTGTHDDAEFVVSNVIIDNNYDNIVIIKDTFDNAAEYWSKPAIQTIDILHIDGLHTYEDTLNNYTKWSKFTNANSVILMHDVTSFDGVRKVYDEIDMPKCMFKHSAGLGVFSHNSKLIDEIKTKYLL